MSFVANNLLCIVSAGSFLYFEVDQKSNGIGGAFVAVITAIIYAGISPSSLIPLALVGVQCGLLIGGEKGYSYAAYWVLLAACYLINMSISKSTRSKSTESAAPTRIAPSKQASPLKIASPSPSKEGYYKMYSENENEIVLSARENARKEAEDRIQKRISQLR